MASSEKRLPPWDQANEEEQKIILFCSYYKGLLNKNRPELIRITQPGPLWSYLRKYDVINKEIEEQIKLNTTSHEMMERFLDLLEVGPTWRFHAFLKGCKETGQSHIIQLLGSDLPHSLFWILDLHHWLNATSHEMMERFLDLLEVGPTWRFHAFLKGCKETGQSHIIQLLGLDPAGYSDQPAEGLGLLRAPPVPEEDQPTPGEDDPLSKSTGSDVQEIIQTLGAYVDKLKVQYNLKGPSMPTEYSIDSFPVYNLGYPRIGIALIINNGEFDKKTRMNTRSGYKLDGELMKGTFEQLGLEVRLHQDINAKDTMRLITEVAQNDHSDTGCFLLLIASHGDEDVIYATDGIIKVTAITERFTSECHPSWAGKPKLFFIQASRGGGFDRGQELVIEDVKDDGTSSSGKDLKLNRPENNLQSQRPSVLTEEYQDKHTVKIPLEADFLLSWSTTAGYFSFKNSGYGSVYIRYLAKALVTYGFEEDILTILTRVNHMVAYGFEASGRQMTNGMKQMPEFTSRLTKHLYFPKPAKKK